MTAAWTSGFVLLVVAGLIIVACLVSWARRTPDNRDAAESHAAYMREIRRQP